MKESIKKRIEAVRRGEVPEGYRRTRAGIMPLDWQSNLAAKDIFRNHTDKKHNGEFQVLSATQDRGIIPRSEVDIDIKYAEENIGSYKKVEPGNFVISLRSFQGGIEYSEYEGLVSPAYTVLKPTRPISDNYYRAYFKTPDFISRLNGAVYGIRDGKQIGFEDFGELAVHYPSLVEQQKIAEILATCDRVIELKQQLLEEKCRQKKWLMQKLLDPDSGVHLPGFETRVWKEIPLSEVFLYIRNGFVGTATPYYVDDGIPYIEGTNIQNGQWDLSEVLHISEEFHRKHPNSVLRTGDVVVVQSGHVGDCTVVTEKIDGSNSHAIIIMTPTPRVNPYFCACYINSPIGQGRLVGCITGNTVKHILASDMKKYLLPCLEKDEQDALANLFCAAEKEITAIEKEIEAWKQKKKALMQLLLTGLVRVNA